MSRKIYSVVLIIIMLSFCVSAQDDTQLKLIAKWDMSAHAIENKTAYFKDVYAGNLFLQTEISDIYNSFKNDYVTNAVGSQQKSLYRSYPVILVSSYDEETKSFNTSPTEILDAINEQLTFETWIKTGTDNDGNLGSIFMVSTEGNKHICSIQAQKTGSNVGIVFRRSFDVGSVYYDVDLKLPLGQWNHLVLSFDSSSASNTPLVVINGQKASVIDRYTGASGNGQKYIPQVSQFILGQFNDDTRVFTLSKTEYGEMNVYKGIMTEQQAIDDYMQQRDNYQNGYDIKLFNNDSEISDLKNVVLKEGKVQFDIDFSVVNSSVINNKNVKIVDMDGKTIPSDCSWNSDVYTMKSDFLDTGSYTFFINKNIKDKDGNAYRTINKTIAFQVVENEELREKITDEINSIFKDTSLADKAVSDKILNEYNYILKLDISNESDYSKLINKQSVFTELRKYEYANLNEIKTGFYKACSVQKEKDVTDAVIEVVSMSKSIDENKLQKMKELLFTKYDTIFKLDTTQFMKLKDSDKVIILMYNLEASTWDKIVEKFNISVEQCKKSELKKEFYENFKIATKENAYDILNKYSEILPIDLKNNDFISYKDSVVADVISKNPQVDAVLESSFYKSVLKHSINGTEVGNRDKTMKLLLKYENYWESPNSYTSLSDIDKMAVCQKLNGLKFSNLEDLKSKVLEIIAELFENVYVPESSHSDGSGNFSHKTNDFSISNDIVPTSIPATEVETNLPFLDIKDVPWALDGIKYLYDNKIVSGKSQTSFAPNDYISRSEMAKILSLAFNITTDTVIETFKDVKKSDWCFPYVTALYETGIMNGTQRDVFSKEEYLSRCDLGLILMRIISYKQLDFKAKYEKHIFSDDALIPNYAKEAIYQMQSFGIMNGENENKFNPTGKVTRAATAKVIHLISAYENGGNK